MEVKKGKNKGFREGEKGRRREEQTEAFLTTPDSVFVFRLSLTFGKSIQKNKTVADSRSQCKTKARTILVHALSSTTTVQVQRYMQCHSGYYTTMVRP